MGVWGSWVGFILLILILIAQLWVAIDPIDHSTGLARASEFFSAFLAAPVVLAFYISFKLVYNTKLVAIDKIDLDTGRYRVRAYPKEEKRSAWKRLYDTFF